MEKRVLLVLIMILAGTGAGLLAEEVKASENGNLSLPAGFAFGVDLADRAGHLAMGLDITSPYFIWERVALRLRGELLFDNRDWNVFFMTKAGLVGVGGQAGKNIRLYAEGGVLFVFPHSDFSSEDFTFGGYGQFGMEFFIEPAAASHSLYFIELGTTGVGLKADRWADAPLLLNGFAVTVGYRLHF